MQTFYDRLEKACQARDLSIPKLAQRLSMSNSTIYRWKDSLPHRRTLINVAAELGVSEAWLQDGTGEMEPSPHSHPGSAPGSLLAEEGAIYQSQLDYDATFDSIIRGMPLADLVSLAEDLKAKGETDPKSKELATAILNRARALGRFGDPPPKTHP